ncbi:MAG: laccase domain-containing protein, partial [Chthoniobacterales bacterium]|nr:laccase domain-containing protein [Chthoniobacterales bacterium]
MSPPVEQFPALQELPGIRHCFIGRVAGIDAQHDKAEALRRLDGVHRAARQELGLRGLPFITAEQVHGSDIAVVRPPITGDHQFAGCDGLATDQPNVALGIYVADCGAVFIIDPVKRAIALVHSGKKGTEQNITGQAIDLLQEQFGSEPKDLIVQLSPCIRPPHYEIDFAAEIIRQSRDQGVT